MTDPLVLRRPGGFEGRYLPASSLGSPEALAFLAALPEGVTPLIERVEIGGEIVDVVPHCDDAPAYQHRGDDIFRPLEKWMRFGVLHREGGPRDWAYWEQGTRRQHWLYGQMTGEDVHPRIGGADA